MVGSPYQTVDHLVEDILFIERFQPEMTRSPKLRPLPAKQSPQQREKLRIERLPTPPNKDFFSY